jgi:hypothetical protein
VLMVCVTTNSPAQLDMSTISTRAGVIRTLVYEYAPSKFQWAFYPEIEIGGTFFTPSISWGVSWGYWSRVDDEYVVFTDKSHVVGVRFSFLPQVAAPHFLIPLKLSVGIADHFITRTVDERKRGTDWDLFPHRWEGDFHSTSFFAGTGLSLRVSQQLRIEAEVADHLALSDQYPVGTAQSNRLVCTLGLAYRW